MKDKIVVDKSLDEVGVSDFGARSNNRVDLNDLLKKKKIEDIHNKKTNLYIFSGSALVALVVIVILNL